MTGGREKAASSGRSKGLVAVLWTLQVLTALFFVTAALPKLTGLDASVAMFDRIGFGQWFRYLTGGLEALGAVMLVIPATAFFGALLLAGVMAGAVLTHLFLIGGSPALAAVFLAVTGAIAYFRRPR